MTIATVVAINRRTGLIALRTDEGELVVAEVQGDTPDVGDQLRGRFDQHGGQTCCAVSGRERFDLVIEALDCSPGFVRQLLGG